MNIEIFSATKSCEQGCSICPLARKDSEVTTDQINTDVQQSFAFFEKLLKKTRTKYELHLGSTPRLFPKIKYPELVHKARFETSKNVFQSSGLAEFTGNVNRVFQTHALNPKILGFSIVPQSPLVSDTEVQLIKNIVGILGDWYYKKQYRSIEVTIRSNLIKRSLYEMVFPHLFATDNLYLKTLAREYGSLYKESDKPILLEEFAGGDIYCSEYKSKSGTQKLVISNRVIASRQIDNVETANLNQIKFVYPRHRLYLDFAIAPRGVMLMHTSLAINNPILWITHSDFRKTLKAKMAGKSKFSYMKFAQKIILQNLVMYRYVLKNKKDRIVTNDDFPGIFEHMRPGLKF